MKTRYKNKDTAGQQSVKLSIWVPLYLTARKKKQPGEK
jgi:hypothetical protein